jgi:hypothetical protein
MKMRREAPAVSAASMLAGYTEEIPFIPILGESRAALAT